jgi:ribonuclease HI
MPFYAVRRGRVAGVYLTWDECLRNVRGFSGASFKKFSSEAEARSFLEGGTVGAVSAVSAASAAAPTPPLVSSLAARTLVLRFDGACRFNPGPGGAGAVLYGVPAHCGAQFVVEDAVAVTRGWQMLWLGAARLGTCTNNVAEYQGLLLGLKALLRLRVRDIELIVQGDSQLVINQVEGVNAVHAPNLQPLHSEVTGLLDSLRKRSILVRLQHVLRHNNAEADRLSNVGLLKDHDELREEAWKLYEGVFRGRDGQKRPADAGDREVGTKRKRVEEESSSSSS